MGYKKKKGGHECHPGFGLSELSFNDVGETGGAVLGGGGDLYLGFGHVFSCLLDIQVHMADKYQIGVGRSGKVSIWELIMCGQCLKARQG